MPRYFVFDVESAGLHGQAFAFGYVLITDTGREVDSGGFYTNPNWEGVDATHREWVEKHVNVQGLKYVDSALELRNQFWDLLQSVKSSCAPTFVACDCPWPVEARFLAQCVDDDVSRYWEGPYPLVDVASMAITAGWNPLEPRERLPSELPEHNPLADARQSARLLIEALDCTINRLYVP